MIDRSFGKFIIIVLLATTVHQTAICFSLIYFVYPIKISKKYLLMTVIGSVAIYIFFGNFLFSRALALLNLSKFEKYIINGENGGLTFFFSYVNIKRPTHKVGQVYTKIDIKPSGLTKKD